MGLNDLWDKVTGKDEENIRTVERALLAVSTFDNGTTKHRVLYDFAEKSGIALAAGLRLHYRKMVILSGNNAESDDFVAALRSFGADSHIEEIDCIVHMHGNPGQMLFKDRTKSSAELAGEISRLGIGRKLRMYYTTACYGSTHAEDMVGAGFSCAAGALGVNTNSAAECPEFHWLWATGATFANCIEKARNADLTKLFDDKARKMGFDDVNSSKRVWGNGNLTITSNAA